MTIPHYFHFGSAVRAFAALALGLLLAACSSSHNWRDYVSQDAPFRVMFPDKPSVHKRTIDLDGMKVEMTMTAVDTDGTMYAVGSAVAPDPAHAQAALRGHADGAGAQYRRHRHLGKSQRRRLHQRRPAQQHRHRSAGRTKRHADEIDRPF